MPRFSDIYVIYNPNGTGPAEQLAKKFKRRVEKADPKTTVQLVRTEYAGHAEELAYKLVMQSKKPLIVSSSGDGGYHEVINGLIRAQIRGSKPVVGLLPGGNANDHYSYLHKPKLIQRVLHRDYIKVDLLKMTGVSSGTPITRYAHSYIGFGFTPEIGSELNKTHLNPLKEAWLVVKGLFTFGPVEITRNKSTVTYDSVICTNIGRMSKILTLSKHSDVADGKFELVLFRRYNKTRLFRILLHASLFSLEGSSQYKSYSFQTTKNVKVQLDGEILGIDSDSTVKIACQMQKLRCII